MKYEKPRWLDKKIRLSELGRMDGLLKDLGLNTVCRGALCPNISECFASGHVTFLILGPSCTRRCLFCNIGKKDPDPVDPGEPERVGAACEKLMLRHVVITSVTRDDLEDGGADHFARTVGAVRRRLPSVKIEVLIPDFQGWESALQIVVASRPDIIGHNLETVARLYPRVRQGASYARSLEVLRRIKRMDGDILTKSGLMLGMGEREEELVNVWADLGEAGCDFLSMGQYLRPSPMHYPVKEYISPERFDEYRRDALKFGFKFVASSPYVRSSYLAHDYLRGQKL